LDDRLETQTDRSSGDAAKAQFPSKSGLAGKWIVTRTSLRCFAGGVVAQKGGGL
jgi:hypothetical protein